MAYGSFLPPIPSPAQPQDYSRQLFGMLDSIGQGFTDRRQDARDYARQLEVDAQKQSQWEQEFGFRRSDADRRYALELDKLAQDEAAGDEYGLSPIYAEGPDGSISPFQLSKSGSTKQVQLPEGYKPSPGVQRVDLGTSWGVLDRAGNVIATIPKHGDIQPGMVQTGPDAQGLPTVAPMGGSKEDIERRQAQSKAALRLDAMDAQANVVIRRVERIKELGKSGWSTGTVGAGMDAVSNVAPTTRKELLNELETVRSNVGFDKLQQMRELSPTGGALGQVSDFENRLMQATQGPLDPMNPEQMNVTLDNIARRYEEAVVAHRIAYMTDYEGLDRNVADQAIDAIRAGKDPEVILRQIEQMQAGGG